MFRTLGLRAVSVAGSGSMGNLSVQLLRARGSDCRSLFAMLGPMCSSRRSVMYITGANMLCFSTYCIMANWIYEGYVDLWYGVYGMEDDDEDDD